MRYAGIAATAAVLSSVVFSSCTCQKAVEAPPTLKEPPSGFHVESHVQPKATPQARADMPTPQSRAQVAAAPTAAEPPKIPDDFPKEVPVFKDAAVSGVQSLANNAHNVIFSTSAPIDEVYQFYQDQMSKSGWKITQQFSRAGHAFATFQKGDMVANVTVLADAKNPGKQYISIMYEQQKPLDFDEF